MNTTAATEAPPAVSARVVLADDHDLVRSGLKLRLEMVSGVKIVAEARNGAELIAAIRQHTPDLVLSNISMPGMDGLSALVELRALANPPRVLVVSMHDSPDRGVETEDDWLLLPDWMNDWRSQRPRLIAS